MKKEDNSQNSEFVIDKSKILIDLMTLSGFREKKDFADFLGIRPNVLSNWLKRNTFDEEILLKKFPEVDKVFILTGIGGLDSNTDEQNTLTTNTKTMDNELIKKHIASLEETIADKKKIIEMLEKELDEYKSQKSFAKKSH